MDPVSRQLTAAAMGLVFALSRDAELEKTRLDLERARMTAEDFRNGGGPDTNFMHEDGHGYDHLYKYRMNPQLRYQMPMRMTSKRTRDMCNTLQDDLEIATRALARIARDGPHKRNVALTAVDDLQLDSKEVEEAAHDGCGAISLGLSEDREEHSDEDSDED